MLASGGLWVTAARKTFTMPLLSLMILDTSGLSLSSCKQGTGGCEIRRLGRCGMHVHVHVRMPAAISAFLQGMESAFILPYPARSFSLTRVSYT
mgnify:FL=1